MKNVYKILMVVSIGLAAVGTGVAIVQPGDLGDDDTTTEYADQGPTETSGDVDEPVVTDPTVEDDPVIADDDPEQSTSSTSSTSTPTSAPGDTGATSTTAAGSGLDADGSANPDDDGLADTGGESSILAGALLAAASIALRRRQRAV